MQLRKIKAIRIEDLTDAESKLLDSTYCRLMCDAIAWPIITFVGTVLIIVGVSLYGNPKYNDDGTELLLKVATFVVIAGLAMVGVLIGHGALMHNCKASFCICIATGYYGLVNYKLQQFAQR